MNIMKDWKVTLDGVFKEFEAVAQHRATVTQESQCCRALSLLGWMTRMHNYFGTWQLCLAAINMIVMEVVAPMATSYSCTGRVFELLWTRAHL
eukprot:20889-Amphidinium_carterae.1